MMKLVLVLCAVTGAALAAPAEDTSVQRSKKAVDPLVTGAAYNPYYSGVAGRYSTLGYTGAYPYSAAYNPLTDVYPYTAKTYPYTAKTYPYTAGAYPYTAGTYPYNTAAHPYTAAGAYPYTAGINGYPYTAGAYPHSAAAGVLPYAG
ncbi:calcium-binding protein P-like [Schistocerca serialis cubense]|uniref:calcium-binding protein P-like n=1 Tax=Schistocerca serialis cubense TaxID=2023355 RepID=UPI00214E3B34|nr:calcium-binding protein P-like [Schistocerca serialis cubense]